MKNLGNIVTDSKINDIDLFNIVSSIEDIDENLPTLIVGLNKTSEYFSDFKVLDWKIKENVYWTPGRRERGEVYERNLEKFKKICIENIFNRVRYEVFNILLKERDEKLSFYKKMKDESPKSVFLFDDMAFIHFDDDIVYGVSLSDIDYLCGNRNKFLSVLLKNKNCRFIDNNVVYNTLIWKEFREIPYIVSYLC